jgi:hypothetical protein
MKSGMPSGESVKVPGGGLVTEIVLVGVIDWKFAQGFLSFSSLAE